MRLELVLIGAALTVVGSMYLFEPQTTTVSNDGGPWWPFGGSSTTYTTMAPNPLGIMVFVSGLGLMILGLVLRREDPHPPPGVVYYVPAPPTGAAPAPPAREPEATAPPAHAAHAAMAAAPAATAPPARVGATAGRFATPLPGRPAPPLAAPPPTSTGAAAHAPPATVLPPPPRPVHPAPPPAPALPTGPQALVGGTRVLDKFEVQRALGQGTFGGTYLAKDLILDRYVVLKELLPQWRDDPDVAARFMREAKVVANLRHPNIVGLYGVEKWGDGMLLVMEYVDGGSLASVLRERGRVPAAEAVRYVDGVLAALEAVHDTSILHRDVKPSNILLTRGQDVRLADFGIAYAPAFGATAGERPPGTSHPGSLPFMAPEQVLGLELDARADLYAVGATLYYLVVGAPYVDLSNRTQEAMRRAVVEEPARLPVEGLSTEMNAFLQKALAKSPADRFPSAAEMRKWLPAK